MSADLAVTVALGLVGIVGTALGAYFAWKQLRPKRGKLLVTQPIQAMPLLRSSVPAKLLRVSFANSILTHPHLTMVRIVNVGSQDIKSSDFDQQRPLRVMVKGARATHFIGDSEGNPCPVSSEVLPNGLTLGPDLIKKGMEINLLFLTEGWGSIEIDEHLFNIDCKLIANEGPPPASLTPLLWYASSVVIGIGTLIWFSTMTEVNVTPGPGTMILAVVGSVVSIACITVTAVWTIRDRRKRSEFWHSHL